MALRKTARELKNEAHMHAIQKNAKVLFNEYGFDRVTVDDICEAAKVSKSTFYNLYKSKEDLFMLATDDERCQYIQTHYKYDESLPVSELFHRFFQVNFDFVLLRSRSETRMLYRGYLTTGNLLAPLSVDNVYLAELHRLIKRGLAENVLRGNLSPEYYWRMITDAMIGCFIGWSTHIEDVSGLDDQYRMILDALVDSFVK